MQLQAILLAAGNSRRFTGNKLLRPLPSGHCLLDIGFCLADLLTSQVLVVINDDPAMAQHCLQHNYPYLVNAQSNKGMASSIAAGVTNTAGSAGWAIFLADMPGILPVTLQQLAETWMAHEITVPTWQTQTGHPVIFSCKYREALCSLRGDRGARELLSNNPEVYHLQTDDPGVCFDIDTDTDLESWLAKPSN